MTESVVAAKARVKHPQESLGYAMIFDAVLAAGEELEVVTALTASPDDSEEEGGLTLDDEAVTDATITDDEGTPVAPGRAVTFRVEGGLDGIDYRVRVTATSSLGNTWVGTGVLEVRSGEA